MSNYLIMARIMLTGNGYITENSYVLSSLPDLRDEIIKNLNLYVYNFLKVDSESCHFYLTNSWINKHVKNDWAQLHHHSNAIISGVYYLKVPKKNKKCGVLAFSKNNSNIFLTNISPKFSEYNNINCDEYCITPGDGKLIMFPSHIKHEVGVNLSDEIRYSLAFNFHIRGTFGGEINKVIIN